MRDNNFRFKGVSLILANTEKAMSLTNGLKLQLRKRTIKEAMETNGSLSHPYPPHPLRMDFWRDYHSLTFGDVVQKYMAPEKVPWNIRLLQHHRNTDAFIELVKILMLPQRVIHKVTKILSFFRYKFFT